MMKNDKTHRNDRSKTICWNVLGIMFFVL